jgi:hypothetical protein
MRASAQIGAPETTILIVKGQTGFENLTGADALITNLRVHPGEKARPLRVAAVVYVEAALSDLRTVIAPYPLIPGLIHLGRPDPHFPVLNQQLHTDFDAFVTNISRVAFKESRDLSLAHSAERTPQDGPLRLGNQSTAEVKAWGD